MADDGMLLNYALAETALNLAPSFKGGRWRDRILAKKLAHHRRPKTTGVKAVSIDSSTKAPESTEDLDSIHQRPRKRAKLSRPLTGRNQVTANLGKEIVSSLFSYNPSSESLPTKKPVYEVVQKPSNAPLIDGLDTFTTLGLSTVLAAHLVTKLYLKAPTAIQKSAVSQLIKEDSDAFIQAETGSGKTLAYLLPIVQRIMKLSKTKDVSKPLGNADGQVHRDSGLFAIILAPTRELCRQIFVVLDSLLGCAHWIVSGTVIGGEKKKSEKARLRKGLNILVATPGRLADHLSNTEVLDVSNVRWLVLDEGDRLMELGFEEEIRGIVANLEDRSRISRVETMPGLPTRRTTVLCSATMKMKVQRLGEISLKNAIHIKADLPSDASFLDGKNEPETGFSIPAQLKQSYAIVPAKQRLVTLTALLKRTFDRKGSVMKAIVFLSCADSVDFHFEALARSTKTDEPDDANEHAASRETKFEKSASTTLNTVSLAPLLASRLNSSLAVYRLHGSLPQPIRSATLSSFARSTNPCILLCTDVASRGLDLPNIDLVIEYDPPFSSDDHLHRVGRTARAGRDGRAMIFLMPGEEEGYIEILKQGYKDGIGRGLAGVTADELLQKGFSASDDSKPTTTSGWEETATEWQLEAERWVVDDKRAGDMARKAFISHVRAYATHVAKEREMFNVKDLHLGHLAKAFALRERPGSFGRGAGSEGGTKRGQASQRPRAQRGSTGKKTSGEDLDMPTTDRQEAARKMKRTMNQHMASANEFNIG